ncbi:hypothetical protein SAMN06272775_5988 [Streptomyces sp. 2323.1]|nr:hypothetical protein SAMN06272775_5988 [Streptomyces sp. 2323.1]
MQPLFDGINSFMRASNDKAALQVLGQHPELLSEQAYGLIRKGINDARDQGYLDEAEGMSKRLGLLQSQR